MWVFAITSNDLKDLVSSYIKTFRQIKVDLLTKNYTGNKWDLEDKRNFNALEYTGKKILWTLSSFSPEYHTMDKCVKDLEGIYDDADKCNLL